MAAAPKDATIEATRSQETSLSSLHLVLLIAARTLYGYLYCRRRRLETAKGKKLVTMAQRHHLARPPYVDPNTNIIFDTDHPEYEGWLTKQSEWIKVRTAWILSSSCLCVCENHHWLLCSTASLILYIICSNDNNTIIILGLASKIFFIKGKQIVFWQERIQRASRHD
jgi:hypothetical protein